MNLEEIGFSLGAEYRVENKVYKSYINDNTLDVILVDNQSNHKYFPYNKETGILFDITSDELASIELFGVKPDVDEPSYEEEILRLSTLYQNKVITDYFSSQNLLDNPKFFYAFKDKFPNELGLPGGIEVDDNTSEIIRRVPCDSKNIKKFRHHDINRSVLIYKKFCYVNEVTNDVYFLEKLRPITWVKLEDPEKLKCIIKEHCNSVKAINT